MRAPDIIGEIVTDDLTLMRTEPETEQAAGFVSHETENRRQRRAGVATFAPHPDLPETEAKGLRRRLLKQRQRLAKGTLDVALRRAQRKATSERR